MEKLKYKYDKSKQAIDSLGDLLKEIDKKSFSLDDLELVYQDALILRFQYSVDIIWKYAKAYLEIKKGIVQKSPKSVFQECLRQELVSSEETEVLMNMLDSRNEITQTYSGELAESISEKIPGFHEEMQKLLVTLVP